MIHAELREMFPHYTWTSVTAGQSGASVYRLTPERSDDPRLYVKTAPKLSTNPAFDLDAEADRLDWLAASGIPVSRLHARGSNDTTTWFATEAVSGISAAEIWPEHQRGAVTDAIAELAHNLHQLPAHECAFDRRLAITVAQAEKAVDDNLVHLHDLEDEYLGWSGQELLAELHRTRPAIEDVVVCHGDLTPENILLDPTTCRVTGVIDVGRLGRADRHLDLALTMRELAIEDDPWFGPRYVKRFTNRYGSDLIDPDRIAFYTLLDEFF